MSELVQTAATLAYEDEAGFDQFRRRGWMLLRNIFGNNPAYVGSWNAITFVPGVVSFGDNEPAYRESWRSGMNSCVNLLHTAIEELQTFKGRPSPGRKDLPATRKVFVVHGRDDALKHEVARLLTQLALEPVILHEQPNKSRGLIQKFEDYSDVGFAVVLLTPDDLGFERNAKPDAAKLRARQNVIFELGFFIGRLGRENVAALFAGDEDFEKPSDYDGVTYIPLDAAGKWKYDLATELQAAGIDVDKNKIK